MTKAEVCEQIKRIGIIPAVRVCTAEEAHFAAECVTSGGIPIVEITFTVIQAVELIAHLVRHHPKMIVGAGTVLNTEMASKCVDAGSHFLTSPGFNPKIVEFAKQKGIAVLPGALTPTEVIEAWDAGSDFVKVFPCAGVGGDRYIKGIRLALPHIPLIASGGVNQQTASNYILAGATALGVGTDLIPAEAIELRQGDRIRELATRFIGFVKSARRQLEPEKERDMAAKTDFSKLHKHSPQVAKGSKEG